MRRRFGRGRGGPGLLGTVARTAVIAGTASAVSGRVGAGAAGRGAATAAGGRGAGAAAADAAAGPDRRPGRTPGWPGAARTRARTRAGARPSVDELHAQLTKLGELRQAGLLTDAEFAEQKARLLA